MHLEYNESMICTIHESAASLKYTVKIKSSGSDSHAIIESTEWMLSTQIQRHNNKNVPARVQFKQVCVACNMFLKQRRLGRRKNLYKVQDGSKLQKASQFP
jgi:hypothetical protein